MQYMYLNLGTCILNVLRRGGTNLATKFSTHVDSLRRTYDDGMGVPVAGTVLAHFKT